MRTLLMVLLGLTWVSCGGEEPPPLEEASAEWQALWAEGAARIDTVGVIDLAEGDTTCGHAGLTIVETTRRFGPGRGEAVAWEFQARSLDPVKLLVFRRDPEGQRLELIGESETVVPRLLGPNRFVLREPIPVERGCMAGLHMPEGEAIPFRTVLNWKTLITTRPLTRPWMDRDAFATYGWRYSVRVLWRAVEEGDG